VPAHPTHVRARGYDQARLLAGALARRTGAPLARPLRRRGPARSQLGATRSERLERGRIDLVVRGAIPAHALLVDDVHTTGATLDACARALRLAGAAEVVAVTWARALPIGSPSTPAGGALTLLNQSRTISAKGSNA
jgi:predicted amidophosphoribosyltransferase